VVVLETAGRSGHWNPHLHILMTSGGMTPQKRWREVDYFPFTVLHKKWQYHLFGVAILFRTHGDKGQHAT
jgi:hypothetical protein